MKSYRKKATGFTLVEIMVALVIVGILAAVAFPTYRNYVITAEITEGLLFADAERINIELFYETHGRMPTSWAEAGAIPSLRVDRMRQVLWRPGISPNPGKGLAAGDTTHTGRISIIMDLADLFGNDPAYSYIAAFYLAARGDQQGNVEWACIPALDSNPALDSKYLPASCQLD